MSIDHQARERLAQQRQHTENLQDNMLERAEEELAAAGESCIAEQAREALTEQRLHEQQLQNNMLERAEEEVGSTQS
jgi:hypothetical protein